MLLFRMNYITYLTFSFSSFMPRLQCCSIVVLNAYTKELLKVTIFIIVQLLNYNSESESHYLHTSIHIYSLKSHLKSKLIDFFVVHVYVCRFFRRFFQHFRPDLNQVVWHVDKGDPVSVAEEEAAELGVEGSTKPREDQ